MGLFATTTSIETMFIGTSFNGLTSAASDMISQAEDEIKKYLSRRYDLSSAYFNTTTSIPPMVRHLALWLSTGYLYEGAARGGIDSYSRADRYIKKAMDNLSLISEGKLDLLDTAGSVILETTTYGRVVSSTEDYAPTFGEDDTLSWDVDATKLSDIESDRS